jgi:hypothetical protein
MASAFKHEDLAKAVADQRCPDSGAPGEGKLSPDAILARRTKAGNRGGATGHSLSRNRLVSQESRWVQSKRSSWSLCCSRPSSHYSGLRCGSGCRPRRRSWSGRRPGLPAGASGDLAGSARSGGSRHVRSCSRPGQARRGRSARVRRRWRAHPSAASRQLSHAGRRDGSLCEGRRHLHGRHTIPFRRDARGARCRPGRTDPAVPQKGKSRTRSCTTSSAILISRRSAASFSAVMVLRTARPAAPLAADRDRIARTSRGPPEPRLAAIHWNAIGTEAASWTRTDRASSASMMSETQHLMKRAGVVTIVRAT